MMLMGIKPRIYADSDCEQHHKVDEKSGNTSAEPIDSAEVQLDFADSEEQISAEGDDVPGVVDTRVAQAHTIPDDSLAKARKGKQQAAAEQDQQVKASKKKGKRSSKTKAKVKIIESGTIIKGYRVVDLLGKGGMGQVYRAVQLSMNREVAFKILSPRLAANKNFRRRFIREARAAGRLHHPNMIAVHDVDEDEEGRLFFSMEIVQGKSIGDHLDEHKTIPPREALRIIREALKALRYAHTNGVVHRDIKPDNIMLTMTGAVKIADMGLALTDDGDGDESGVTVAGTMMGTPYYMPPEQGRDAHGVDHRADLYSLGATLYHMLVGRVPFTGDTPVDVVVKATTEPVTFPEEAAVHEALQDFIVRLMAKSPDDRPQSAADAQQLLQHSEDILEGRKPAARSSRSRAQESNSESRSPKRWVALGIAAVIVLGLFIWWQGKPERALRDAQVDARSSINNNNYQQAIQVMTNVTRQYPQVAASAQQFKDDFLEQWDEFSQQESQADIGAIEAALVDDDIESARQQWRQLEARRDLASPWMKETLEAIEDDIERSALFQEVGNILTTNIDAGIQRPNILAVYFDYQHRGVQPELSGDGLRYRLTGSGGFVSDGWDHNDHNYTLMLSIDLEKRRDQNYRFGLLWGTRSDNDRRFIGVMADHIATIADKRSDYQTSRRELGPGEPLRIYIQRRADRVRVWQQGAAEKFVELTIPQSLPPRLEWYLGEDRNTTVRARLERVE